MEEADMAQVLSYFLQQSDDFEANHGGMARLFPNFNPWDFVGPLEGLKTAGILEKKRGVGGYRLASWVVERRRNAQFRETLLGLYELKYMGLLKNSRRHAAIQQHIESLKSAYDPTALEVDDQVDTTSAGTSSELTVIETEPIQPDQNAQEPDRSEKTLPSPPQPSSVRPNWGMIRYSIQEISARAAKGVLPGLRDKQQRHLASILNGLAHGKITPWQAAKAFAEQGADHGFVDEFLNRAYLGMGMAKQRRRNPNANDMQMHPIHDESSERASHQTIWQSDSILFQGVETKDPLWNQITADFIKETDALEDDKSQGYAEGFRRLEAADFASRLPTLKGGTLTRYVETTQEPVQMVRQFLALDITLGLKEHLGEINHIIRSMRLLASSANTNPEVEEILDAAREDLAYLLVLIERQQNWKRKKSVAALNEPPAPQAPNAHGEIGDRIRQFFKSKGSDFSASLAEIRAGTGIEGTCTRDAINRLTKKWELSSSGKGSARRYFLARGA